MATSEHLARVLEQLAKGDHADKKVDSFFTYLSEKNLITLLPQILKHVVLRKEQQDNFNTLRIVSRYPLSEEQLGYVKEVVGAPDEIVLEKKVDEHMLGSFTASYQGSLYDGSLDHDVLAMRRALTQ